LRITKPVILATLVVRPTAVQRGHRSAGSRAGRLRTRGDTILAIPGGNARSQVASSTLVLSSI